MAPGFVYGLVVKAFLVLAIVLWKPARHRVIEKGSVVGCVCERASGKRQCQRLCRMEGEGGFSKPQQPP
jgi:hypothetical protein